MLRAGFIAWRVAQMVPTLMLALILVFVLARLLPGNPALAVLGEKATNSIVLQTQHAMGLDQPLPVQFWIFLRHALGGDLGRSLTLRVPVSELIAQRLPVTAMLTVMAAVLAAMIAVPSAFVAALYRDRGTDIVIRGVFQLGVSIPVFYLGLALLIALGAGLRWFPVGGFGDGIGDNLYHLVLPALTLALSLSAILMRNLRASIIEVLDADYVQFAIAKGLSRSLVLRRHVLRNAILPTVTLFGLHIGMLIGGAVITETVFAIPGIGTLMVNSIFARDYQVVQGLTLVIALLVSFVFLVVDITIAWLDPRPASRR